MNMRAMPGAALLRLIEQVRTAAGERRALDIRGGGTKAFLGGARRGEPLALRELAGISSHEPTELVVTARAGTPLAELESVLAAAGQYLPFDPPRFAAGGTVGGMVAAGLAGPARACVGGVRDHVLGVTLLDGRGEVLGFGGQVMKNVAGYDISRLMVGSMGILGAILEVSIKVLPRPRAVETVALEAGEAEALALMAGWRGRPLPIHASAWHRGELRVRLAGARAAVQAARAQLGGRRIDAKAAESAWAKLRDHRCSFFDWQSAPAREPVSLWRLSVPAGTPPLQLAGSSFIEWGGGLRWLRTHESAAAVHAAAQRAGGHAMRWGGQGPEEERLAPLNGTTLRIHRQLKRAFDPHGVFNPGRLHPEL